MLVLLALLLAISAASLWPVSQGRAEITLPETLTGVIALGGGDERIREAGRLARRFPKMRVVVSGMSPVRVYKLLGPWVGPDRVQIEPTARNTHENAVNTTELLRPRPGERWLLITSASHLPRALCSFAKAGFPVEPWPVRELGTTKEREERASREQFALGAYQLLGWCDPDP